MANTIEPFVGPRPFEPEDKEYFFGRDREATELVSLILAHATVVLYAQSGAGKTSLLKTKVLTALKEKKGFDVLPIARVHSQVGPTPDETTNVYVANALRDMSENRLTPEERSRLTFAAYLASRPYPPLPADEDLEPGQNDAAVRRPRVMILDQFEELFTLYPERYKDRRLFFEHVRDALTADSLLRVVFSMREDYVAELDPYVYILPDALRTRYRMERLRHDSALKAVLGPLAHYSKVAGGADGQLRFDKGVAEKLIDNLRTIKVRSGQSEIEFQGEFIEPVHLQIVGKALTEKMLAEKHATITEKDLAKFGNVNQALTEYFERALTKAAAAGAAGEADLRRWFDRVLITPDNNRSTVLRGTTATAGIPNDVVDILEKERVIRSETRDNRLWYELSHDKLIEPIRASYQQWLLRQPTDEKLRLRLIARAEQYIASQPKNAKLLLNETEIEDASRWSHPNGTGYDPALPPLIEASRTALATAEAARQRQKRKKAQLMIVGLAVALVAVGIGLGIVYTQRQRAQELASRLQTSEAKARQLQKEAEVSAIEASEERLKAQIAAADARNEAQRAEAERAKAADQQRLAQQRADEAKAAQNAAEKAKREADEQANLAKDNERAANEALELARKNELKANEALKLARANELRANEALELAKANEIKANNTLEELRKQIALTDEKEQEAREQKELVTALTEAANRNPAAASSSNTGKLTVRLTDVYDKPLASKVDITLRNLYQSGDTSVVREVDASKPIVITKAMRLPPVVYSVLISAAGYRPVSQFVNMGTGAAELRVTLPIDPAKVSAVEFPAYAALPADIRALLTRSNSVLSFEQRAADGLYNSLDDLRKANLLNIIAKARATRLDDGETVLEFIREIRVMRPDRFLVVVSDELLDETRDSVEKGLLAQVSDALSSPPDGFARRGSYKTTDRYANLQLTFFSSGNNYLADINIDDEGGLGHVYQVDRKNLASQRTHPYDIHEILVTQKIDPSYRVSP